VLELETA
jgi:hypothetical protein